MPQPPAPTPAALRTPPAVRRPSLPKTPEPKRKRRNWRKTLFRVHGWIGLNLGLLLFVICFSGSFATLSHEIDRLLDPAIRVEAQDAPYDWTAMHEALDEAFPDGQHLGLYAPGASGMVATGAATAAVAYVRMPTGQNRKAYLDPYTGQLTGHTSFFNAHRFFRSFHRRFFDGQRGIVIVTLTSFALLLATLTGFLFYKGWLKQLVTFRRDKGRRLLWSDLHKTSGIWGLLFTLLIALTGVFYFAEVVVQEAGNYDALLPPPLPQVEEASLATYGPQPELLPAHAYVEAAQAAFPGLRIRSMRMPHRPGDPVYLDGQAGNPVTRDRANKVLVHPFSGEVIGVQRSSELGAVPFLTDAADPLHFGYFGGLATKVLWCLLGLLLSFSILAGAYLWVVRTLPKRPTRGVRSFWLRGATASVALTLAYFLVVTFATVRGIQDYTPPKPAPRPVATAELGPYEVRLDCEVPCRDGGEAAYTVRFLGTGLPNYREATLSTRDGEAETLTGPAYAPSATLRVEEAPALRLAVMMRDGTTHEATLQPTPEGALQAERPRTRVPDTAPGVWWVIALFVTITVAVILGWLAVVVRVLRVRTR